MGLVGGEVAAGLVTGAEITAPPRESAFGSLTHYLTHAEAKNFQPVNITFDLLPALEHRVRDKQERHRLQCERGLAAFDAWLAAIGTGAAVHSHSYIDQPRIAHYFVLLRFHSPLNPQSTRFLRQS